MYFDTHKLFHEQQPTNYQAVKFPYQHEVADDTKKHTQDPIVTGTSILGIRYKGGVMLCSDTLGSYGSLARFRSLNRIKQVGSYSLVAASGEYSDFQYIIDLLERQVVDKDYCADDNTEVPPNALYQYLVRIMYNRRNQFNPLWNSLVVAGYKNGKPFLGYTDLLGSNFIDETMATGYGAYLAKPILRKFVDEKGGVDNISEEEAKDLLEKCMKVLYYRDARSLNKMQLATVSDSGITISEPYSLPTEWTFKGF